VDGDKVELKAVPRSENLNCPARWYCGGVLRSLLPLCIAPFLAITFAQSQEKRALMLPSPVRLVGIVTDNSGVPLSDVWINHTGDRFKEVSSDPQGRFDFQTSAPAIVFRKRGFQSKYHRVDRSATISIQLEARQPALPLCTRHSGCLSLQGFGGAFCLTKVSGVKATAQGNDVDYGGRSFVIVTHSGKNSIEHGGGPMWGEGMPFDEDVWSAQEYVEANYRDADGFAVVDARGKNKDGTHWRSLGRFGETATYHNALEQNAMALDKVLDRVCVKPTM
jgi:hypothetical protein